MANQNPQIPGTLGGLYKPPGQAPISQMNDQGLQYGGNAQGEAQRLQQQGSQMGERRAPRLNWKQADAYGQQAQGARDSQSDAMSLAQAAAYGNAPSAAQMLSQNMLDQSLQSQMAGAASARGGSLAQAAAMRNAANQAGVMQQQGMNQIGAMRAQEMAQARGEYGQMAGAMRGQDFQAQQIAQQQQMMGAQNQLSQRQLNQQGQLAYEGMAQGAYGSQLNANMGVAGMQEQARQADIQRKWQSSENEKQFTRDLAGKVVGGAMGGAGFLMSDMRSKQPVQLGMGPDMAIAMPGQEQGARPTAPGMTFAQGAGGFARAIGGALSGVNFRDTSKPLTPEQQEGGLAKAIGGGMMLSDDRAKLAAAWDEGHRAAAEDVRKLAGKSPEELKTLGESRPLAAVVRDVKAGAWDEGRTAPKAVRQPVTFQRNPDGAPVPPPPAAVKALAAAGPVAGVPGLLAQGHVLGDNLGRYIYGDPGPVRDARDVAAEGQMTTSDERAKDVGSGSGMADAARAMESSAYAYKPGMEPPEQEPGEPNVGPMAQNMAANPVTATAVKKDPRSGLLMIDQSKMTKVLGGVVADQQKQIDQLAALVAKRGK